MADKDHTTGSGAATGVAVRRGRFVLSRQLKDDITGHLFIAPWLLGFLLWTLGPFIASLVISFMEWAILGRAEWIGLANYLKIFTDDRRFGRTLFNTAYYVLFHVPGVQVIALGLALLLNQRLRGISIFRTIFYLPSVTSGVATAVLWSWILNSKYGLLNIALWSAFRIEGPAWLNDPRWSMPALILMSLWGTGSTMIIYLAGLQGIPEHLYEAAEIDGAGTWRKFWHVTIPMLTPSIFFNMVMGIIGSFQVFTAAYIITGGGPGISTLFYVLYLYRMAFENFRMGYASALAWILFVIILFFTLIQLALAKRWVYYEAETGQMF